MEGGGGSLVLKVPRIRRLLNLKISKLPRFKISNVQSFKIPTLCITEFQNASDAPFQPFQKTTELQTCCSGQVWVFLCEKGVISVGTTILTMLTMMVMLPMMQFPAGAQAIGLRGTFSSHDSSSCTPSVGI